MSIKNCMETPKWGFIAATREGLPDRQPADELFREGVRFWNNPLAAAANRRATALLAQATGCHRATLALVGNFLARPPIDRTTCGTLSGFRARPYSGCWLLESHSVVLGAALARATRI